MSLKVIHTQIANKWVRINGISKELKSALKGFKGNNLFGYVYIDHTHGITLDIAKLFNDDEGDVTLLESPNDRNERVICRLTAMVSSEETHILSEKKVKDYNLETFDLSAYDRKDLDEFRLNEHFHPFRGDGFPDDVQILFPPIGKLKPELIWCRVEKYEHGKITCQVLNKPHQNFGIQLNDMVTASMQTINNEKYIVCELNLNTTATPSVSKPWWKFW